MWEKMLERRETWALGVLSRTDAISLASGSKKIENLQIDDDFGFIFSLRHICPLPRKENQNLRFA